MSQHLTHVLRRMGPGGKFYVRRIDETAKSAVLAYSSEDAQRFTRAEAERIQGETAGWYEAVPVLAVITAPRIWGTKQSQEIHR